MAPLFSPALLMALSGCGPDPELLERVVRLETEMAQVRGELEERAHAPAKCAQAKKVAFDAWEVVWAVANKQVRSARKRESDFNEVGWASEDRRLRHKDWQERRNAATAAKRAAIGGAIKAKAAADYAATLHIAGEFDTTLAMAASDESWAACKGQSP
jgi:hypothetical protein